MDISINQKKYNKQVEALSDRYDEIQEEIDELQDELDEIIVNGIQKLKNNIYNYLKSNGYEPLFKSTNGKEVSIPEEAEVIEFNFITSNDGFTVPQ